MKWHKNQRKTSCAIQEGFLEEVGLEVGPEKGLVLDKWVKQQASSQEGEVS